MKLTILGCGFSGIAIARAALQRTPPIDVLGTRRSQDALDALRVHGIDALLLDGVPSRAAIERLACTTHLISSVAPAREPPLSDPIHALIAGLAAAGRLPSLRWIGYLSTIGVYGDHEGAWVDETTPCRSAQPRSLMRIQAEQAWRALASELHCPLAVLRLSGIYGPGRNAVRDALHGRARILIKPGQRFNRIHVDDLAQAALLAAECAFDGVLNVSDDEPAPPQDVVRFAHALTERDPPTAVAFEDAELSPMARSFYAENKRVDNARSKRVLGLQYRFPDYRTGLAALLEHERANASTRTRTGTST